MKTTVKTAIALSLALVMLFALVSCDKSAAIKKAYEDAGYTVTVKTAEDSEVKGLLEIMYSEQQLEEMKDYEIIYCSMDGLANVLKKAIIIKFPSAKELKASLTVEDEDGKKDTSKYDEAVEDGIINGNCMIITIDDDTAAIFKKA